MATHKVPQDVETEDKLIGFLSMKQFIFVVVGLGFGWLTFFFATKVSPFLAIIWVPFTVVPLVLGLYQRKDQPVEVFLASALRFYFKPRKRTWDQEGYFERVIVTAPPKIERRYTKNFTGEEAVGRLQNLSRMMDSRGWATKLDVDWQNQQMAEAAASESRIHAQPVDPSGRIQAYMQPADVMDESSSVIAQNFQSKIDSADTSTRAHAMKTLEAARGNPQASSIETLTPDSPGAPPAAKVASPESAVSIQTTKPKPAVPKKSDTNARTSDDGSVEISLH